MYFGDRVPHRFTLRQYERVGVVAEQQQQQRQQRQQPQSVRLQSTRRSRAFSWRARDAGSEALIQAARTFNVAFFVLFDGRVALCFEHSAY
jgi:hypothetical protein